MEVKLWRNYDEFRSLVARGNTAVLLNPGSPLQIRSNKP
jgi:hypothetical protein